MKVTQFDGTFELAFLRDTEKVRSAGKDTDAIEILDGESVVARAEKGNWLVRTPSGEIAVHDGMKL